MIEPSLRTARAPMRPETACSEFVVRPTWTLGSGPTLDQAPPTVPAAPFELTRSSLSDASMPLRRSWAAVCSEMGWSPESSRDSK